MLKTPPTAFKAKDDSDEHPPGTPNVCGECGNRVDTEGHHWTCSQA